MRNFYDPTPENLTRLDGLWNCAYSGGKDSSGMVTVIEFWRRMGWITAREPKLVQSNTGVEDTMLQGLSNEMMDLLREHDWECVVVEPMIHEKLYNRILGAGNVPIHPGVSRMRWCTQATKVGPLSRWRDMHATGLTLTGLRLGESAMRDGKIKKAGCASGGECGIPDPDERTYSPILNWTMCNVIDWLMGHVSRSVQKMMSDVFAITKRLVEIYDVKIDQNNFEFADPKVSASRFGCIGCPAIQAEAHAPASSVRRYGANSPLNELYAVWFEARRRKNRCFRMKDTFTGESAHGYGPIRMAVRKVLFERVMDIQRRAGVVLVTPEDEAFIRSCWANDVYPRGWSKEDELTEPPMEMLYELSLVRGDT